MNLDAQLNLLVDLRRMGVKSADLLVGEKGATISSVEFYERSDLERQADAVAQMTAAQQAELTHLTPDERASAIAEYEDQITYASAG